MFHLLDGFSTVGSGGEWGRATNAPTDVQEIEFGRQLVSGPYLLTGVEGECVSRGLGLQELGDLAEADVVRNGVWDGVGDLPLHEAVSVPQCGVDLRDGDRVAFLWVESPWRLELMLILHFIVFL